MNQIEKESFIIKESWNSFGGDIKIELQERKYWIFISGALLTLTSLFLNIQGENAYLKRIQALLLLISATFITILLFSVLIKNFSRNRSDLYWSFNFFLFLLTGVFVYNICLYLKSEFYEQIVYFLDHLFPGFCAIFINLLFVYFLRFTRKIFKNKYDFSLLGGYFLLSLNYHIIITYSRNSGLIETIKSLLTPSFKNLNFLYYFLILFGLAVFEERLEVIVRQMKRKTLLLIIFLVMCLPLIIGMAMFGFYGNVEILDFLKLLL